ncbi:MAG: hypothetical protein HRU24_16510 [Gammaproteobacteria bacterium]|nr:hypothetical protein [Gammaproteobacteria bacterium]
MQILIGASNAFIKWMGIDLPRIPSNDGKRIGVQTISSSPTSVAWQCHALLEHSKAQYATIIAVEARSRFCIIFSNLPKLSMGDFDQHLKDHWLRNVLFMSHQSGAVTDSQEIGHKIVQQFNNTVMDFNWVKNTDLSVSGHVSDVEQWIRSGSVLNRANHLSPPEANELAYHINTQRKKAKQHSSAKKMAIFIPVARLLDDGLFRFAKGLSGDRYPETKLGDFPNPYPSLSSTISSNVVFLEHFRKNKN